MLDIKANWTEERIQMPFAGNIARWATMLDGVWLKSRSRRLLHQNKNFQDEQATIMQLASGIWVEDFFSEFLWQTIGGIFERSQGAS